ncbi:hypothetical protein [Thalassorhabdomicrobium marinisediminis]|uniref:Ferrochelatase n=1 Tax=Thalassorhabdomicrobium marinisediminis TaxID=2170577 RepID=A0A2T7FVB9_9RHOB|nr:hypothetical protein [Thalassorhabdomicrobium marinisediminis]PVA06123.1 hypothetical protein DC363_12500 [Thalassorhabdomicrobium marinisediminis]
MKKTSLLAASFFAVSTMTATAGGLSAPVMEPVVIVEEVETASDTSGLLQWMILAAVIVAATAN